MRVNKYGLISALFCLLVFSTKVNATTVAKIGNLKYTSLENAIEEVLDGETIVLTKNTKIATKLFYHIDNNVKFTIDLNGHILSSTQKWGFVNDSDVTIKNGTLKNIYMTNNKKMALKNIKYTSTSSLNNYGTMLIESGSYNGGSKDWGGFIDNEKGVLTIKGGDFRIGSGVNYLIGNNATLNIKGGSFRAVGSKFKSSLQSDDSCTIKCLYNSKTVITGGDFSNDNATVFFIYPRDGDKTKIKQFKLSGEKVKVGSNSEVPPVLIFELLYKNKNISINKKCITGNSRYTRKIKAKKEIQIGFTEWTNPRLGDGKVGYFYY